MLKKVYTIIGFDCANCAAKAESHLNNHPNINLARIDFSGNKLYLTFEDKELSIEEIKNYIKEVENEPLTIEESNGLELKTKKIFDKKLKILLVRILISLFLVLGIGFICTNTEGKNTEYWIRFAVYIAAVVIIWYDVAFKVLNKIFHLKNPIDEYLLISLAVIGAFIVACLENSYMIKTSKFVVGEQVESVMVVLLFQIGRVVEGIATNKSKQAIMTAVDLRSDYANKFINNEIIRVKPEELVIGDIVIVKMGEIIPIDGVIISGNGSIDKSSLTGEYVPENVSVDQEVFGGCLLRSGSITLKVNKEYSDSTVAKILKLISNSGERKSTADKFITKFAKIYTPAICIISLLFIIISGLVTKDWSSSAYKGLEILVVACPCAIVISVPLAYFAGIGLASKNGIVIKGTNYFDELVKMKKLITDKTGTLTHGSFNVQHIECESCSEEELLNNLYAVECLSNHPIAKAICHGKNLKKLAAEQIDFVEIPGKGNISKYHNDLLMAGSYQFMINNGIDVPSYTDAGTVVYVSKNKKYLGFVVLSDEIKEDAQPMVNLLHHSKVEIILLTGDNEENAKSICDKLGIDRFHANLLPEQKTYILEKEMNSKKYATAFIGDGINDAPSIIRSDIGFAMGGIGSDAAVENADIVIMNDDPAKVYDSLWIAKTARKTAIFNIVFSLLVKVIVAILCMIMPNIPMEIAVLADTGLTVLMVINSLLILYRKIKRPQIK